MSEHRDPPDGIPQLTIGGDDDAICALLRELQGAALAHTEAARGLFAALVSEGRLFAQTGEGRRWHQRLLGSALLERALLVWQSATCWVTEESRPGTPPSALIDALATAAGAPERDLILDRLFRNDELAGPELAREPGGAQGEVGR